MGKFSATIFMGILAALALAPAATESQAAEPNFKGKTVTILIGSRAGGGTDAMGRLVGGTIIKYLPGKPKVIFRNMSAGSGIKALNYFVEKVKTDGLTMLAGSATTIRPDTLRKKTVRFKPRQFKWVGALPAPGGLIAVHKTAMGRFADRSKKPIIMGGVTGRRGAHQMAVWGPEYLGWNIRWVVGYGGTAAMNLAFERGEVQANANYDTFVLRPWQKSGTYAFPAQVGIVIDGKFVRRPDFPDVPIFAEMVEHKLKGRALSAFKAWKTLVQVGKWFALPPKTPKAVVKAYQAAYAKTMKDKAFDKRARKLWSPVYTWATGKEMAQVVDYIVAVTDEDMSFIEGLRKKVGIPVGARNLMVKAAITKTKRGGRRISFKVKGKSQTVKVSGSRTEVLRKGDYISRKKLKVGMVCEFIYPGNKKTAKSITCD